MMLLRGVWQTEIVSKFSVPSGGPVKANLEVSILVPPGTIDAQYGWKGEEDTQRLVPRQWDPLSGYAPYFEVNVEVRKVGSQMSRMGIIVNVDECIGCHACFIACKQENQVSPNIQWNRIRKVENREKNIINYFRASCQHCEDPACLKVCPMKAVYKGPHGEILIDQDKCIACKACLAACPMECRCSMIGKLTKLLR